MLTRSPSPGLAGLSLDPDQALAEALDWQSREGKGQVVWITGLSGVGKTALAAGIHLRLRALGAPVAWLDGDALRRHFGAAGIHLEQTERLQLAVRYASFAADLARAGAWVLVSTISLFHCIHEFNRTLARNHDFRYREIWLRADELVRQQRAADRFGGPRVGHDQPAQLPLAPDLILNNDDSPATLCDLVDCVIRSLEGQADVPF
ncbi:MAG: adenylyl-sulfate kinase [Wenzhouxiangella sp.]